MSAKPFETISVTHEEIPCDGPKGPSGHPRIYLHIDRETGQVTCPYCSRQYVLEDAAEHRSA